MENFFAFLTANPRFKKICLNEITVIEYDCPLEEAVVPIWTPHDYFVHVLNGKKTWHSYPDGKFVLEKGDTAYIKKGGHFVHQHFEDKFCLLILFITDQVKKEFSFSEVPRIDLNKQSLLTKNFYRIKSNTILEGFFYSVLSYFTMPEPPHDEIKKLKLKEFMHVLTSEPENIPVIRELLKVEQDNLSYLKSIMNQNFMYNLSLKEFAELCNRSISSFRRDFKRCYQVNLGQWLSIMRLKYASSLLVNSNLPIAQVALESGFENLSHFSRCFREKFLVTPSQYRKQKLNTTG